MSDPKNRPPEEPRDGSEESSPRGATNSLYVSVREFAIDQERQGALVSELLESSARGGQGRLSGGALAHMVRCWLHCSDEEGLDPEYDDAFGDCVSACVRASIHKELGSETRTRWTAFVCLLLLKYLFKNGWDQGQTLDDFLADLATTSSDPDERMWAGRFHAALDDLVPHEDYRDFTSMYLKDLDDFDGLFQQHLGELGLR